MTYPPFLNQKGLPIRLASLLLACNAAVGMTLAAAPTDHHEATQEANQTLSEMDKNFATKAVQGGVAEIQIGELAKKSTQNKAVHTLADELIKDHTQANNELQEKTRKLHFLLPVSTDTTHQSEVVSLSKLKDENFDQQFLKQLKMDHQKTISLFSDEATKGQCKELKDFAAQTLPKLQHHLSMIEKAEQNQK